MAYDLTYMRNLREKINKTEKNSDVENILRDARANWTLPDFHKRGHIAEIIWATWGFGSSW